MKKIKKVKGVQACSLMGKKPFRMYAAFFVLVLLPGLLCQTEGFAADADVSIAKILEGVQQRYGSSDFEADFVQESHMDAMGIVDSAKGHVYFRPPFKMRWHYKEPEEYMIITDGESVWIYRPLDHQVMVGKAKDYFGDTSFSDFFSNPAKLQDKFLIEKVFRGDGGSDRHALRLIPGKGAANVEEVFLFISKKTFDIVQSDTYNAFGDRTRLQFSSFNIAPVLEDALFQFKIPKNVDVLQLDRPF